MNTYQLVFICLVICLVGIYLFDRISGRKITLAILQWKPAVAAMSALVKAIASIVPSSYFATVSVILDAASAAAQKAEKLYLLNKLPKEERNSYAQKLIIDTLEHAGIEVTEQVQEIIDGCIAVVCMLMPHGLEPQNNETI